MNPKASTFTPAKKPPRKRKKVKKKPTQNSSEFIDLRKQCGCEQVRDQLEEMKLLLWQVQKQAEILQIENINLEVEINDWKDKYNALRVELQECKAKHADLLNTVCFVQNLTLSVINKNDNCTNNSNTHK